MEQLKITLYGYITSPYVQKVNSFLIYKRLKYSVTFVDPVSARQIAFTDQRSVPVLEIGDEWRKDSTPLGIWLDECFPDKPITGVDKVDRENILAVDHWISHQFIPQMLFRRVVRWESPIAGLYAGWRLAALLNSTQPLPFHLRVMWPFILRRVGFIRRILENADMQACDADIRRRILKAFIQHLDGGPFFAGRDTPSIADIGLYGIMMSNYVTMIPKWVGEAKARPPEPIWHWMERVQRHLPAVPVLAPKRMWLRDCPFATAEY